jgi:hypothetical protein
VRRFRQGGEAVTRVVNLRGRSKIGTVYIGRPSVWGNPFSHVPGTTARFRVQTREEAIAKYEVWVQQQPHLVSALPGLRGKILSCWCKPLPCHGDVLARLADLCPST